MSEVRQELPRRFACRCCGAWTLSAMDAWEICPACEWEDDPSQAAHPDMGGGANVLSLNEARRHWLATGTGVPRAGE